MDLFGDKDTLVTYFWRYGPQRERPCPMGTNWLGSVSGNAADIQQRVALKKEDVIRLFSVGSTAGSALAPGWHRQGPLPAANHDGRHSAGPASWGIQPAGPALTPFAPSNAGPAAQPVGGQPVAEAGP